MARPFSSQDAKRLIEDHQQLLASLGEIAGSEDSFKLGVQRGAEALVTQETFKLLKDIPIDEINRGKKGFRIKTLQDYGYNTIADIAAASDYSLSSIYGISKDAAQAIRSTVNGIISQARKTIKIRISADSRTPAATQLVSALSQYKNVKPIIDRCASILSHNEKNFRRAIEDLAVGTRGFSWIFTSGAKKQQAEKAYQFLLSMIQGPYGMDVRKLLEQFEAVQHTSNSAAWQDFSQNSVRFFNVLEDVCPGVLGNDDSIYGLPEDLAREIQDQTFFPDGLLCELRRYQEWGVKYILHQERVLLGDEMGLGKTVQAIASMVSLRNTGATHFVVVCPASVITNWCREIRKMSLLSVTKVHGADRKEALQSWIKTGGVAVTTYETTGHFTLPEGYRFSMLVVDEAHYIKNPEARRSENVLELSLHAERLLFMTGTALENKVEEMISLIRILQPRVAQAVSGMAFMSAAPQFRNAVAPVYYRRKREDVLTELPELIESREWCVLGPEEERVYEQAVLAKHYPDARRVSWSVDDPSYSSKAKRMLEIIDEAAEDGRKVIVFSFFLDTIRKVCSLLGDRCLSPINGSVTPQRRQQIIDEFEAAPPGSVLAAQLQSGGTGLNIQSASVVILCEPQFKPSIENQAISRAYRMGQTRNVLVFRLLCENTVDEKIMSTLESKQAIFDAFADKSVAASESMAIDDKTFGNIIKEEIDRINAKYGRVPTAARNQPHQNLPQ